MSKILSLIDHSSLDRLNLESSKDCVFDQLSIYDGSSRDDVLLLGPICGKRDEGTQLYVSQNFLLFR